MRHSSYDSLAKSFSFARPMRDLYKGSFGVVIRGTSFVGDASAVPRAGTAFKEVMVSDTRPSSFDSKDRT